MTDRYELALPFDTENPEFSRGFEAGMLWHRWTPTAGYVNLTWPGSDGSKWLGSEHLATAVGGAACCFVTEGMNSRLCASSS
jgi:hypothetical protein